MFRGGLFTAKTHSTEERDALGIVNACSTCHLLGRFIVHVRGSVRWLSTLLYREKGLVRYRPLEFSEPREASISRTGMYRRFVEFIIDLHVNRFNPPRIASADSRD